MERCNSEYEVDGNDDIGNEANEIGYAKLRQLVVHDVLGVRAKNRRGDQSGGETSNFQLIDEETSLYLHNDCAKPVKELRKILDVYNSDKTESATGENGAGAGVKQAAAAMSNLSIIVTSRIENKQ